jgi:hypothetical protein
MDRLYRYIGPPDIARRAAGNPPGVVITSPADVRRWVNETRQGTGRVVATFVVDAEGRLRLADRHSEHVACAAGGPILAAGEITFRIADEVKVEAVSNQSTGYCPEPQSWPAVVRSLHAAGLDAPKGYAPALIFRRCPACAAINVVKEDVFACAECEADLPAAWNLAGPFST